MTVYVLLCFLLLFTLVSSYYDYRLKLRQPDPSRVRGNVFYQHHLKTRMQQFFTIFSLCRNYYRITLPSNSELSRDLRFFDAFRVISVFVVILGHTLMVFMTVQIQNPEFYEQFLYRFETSIFQNGSAFIQIFFVMSSFLLYVNFTKRQWINKGTGVLACIAVYFRVFFSRYFRMLPSLIMVILLNATILTRLGDGPFWRHLTEAERVFCRTNWWKNVFFINNYLLEESVGMGNPYNLLNI